MNSQLYDEHGVLNLHLVRRLTGPSVFTELAKNLKQDYVNELAYKLTVFDNNDVGRCVFFISNKSDSQSPLSYPCDHFRAAVRALIAVCEVDSSMVTLLADKFR